ncbi:MAG: sulfurtransferase TusA family protein, partial [Myxococcota bacterium]
MNSQPTTTELDLRGLRCPAPIVTTSKAVSQLSGRGTILRILADDDGFAVDLKSWCRATKAELMSIERAADGVFVALVRVNDGAGEAASAGAAEDAADNGDGHRDTAAGSEPAAAQSGDARAAEPSAAAAETGVARAARRQLDYRGKRCPEPIILLAKEARTLREGGEFEVLADDEAFPMDLKAWCRSSGAALVALDQDRATPTGSGRTTFRAVIRARPRLASGSTTGSGTGASLAHTDAAAQRRAGHLAGGDTIPSRSPDSPAAGRIQVDLSAVDGEVFRRYLASLDVLAAPGMTVAMTARHATFAQDVASWCARAGHTIERLNSDRDPMVAEVALRPGGAGAGSAVATGPAAAPASAGELARSGEADSGELCTLLVLHNDMETLLAALMTANAAASSGMAVNVFFAFWGLNLLRGERPRSDVPAESVSLLQQGFKMMMPSGPRRQRLGKLSF